MPGREESLKILMFPAACMVSIPGCNFCRRIDEHADNGRQLKRGSIMKMTDDQKQKIETLRRQGIGYCTVAKRVGLPANTVKTFCRRNNLSSAVLSDGAPSRKPQAGTSVQTSAEQIQMKKESGSYSSKGKSSAECEVTLSFSTNPDMSAVEDVMTALMNSLER